MKTVLERSGDGWGILGTKGQIIKEMQEVCFMVDLKHGLALFPGTEEETLQRVERIGRKCPPEDREKLRVALLGRDIDKAEANYMMTTRKIPRRVQIRLK